MPYVLMSRPSVKPNLRAVNVSKAYEAKKIFCFHYNETKPQGKNTLKNENSKITAQKEEKSSVDSFLEVFENDFNAFV
jgi:hypothetical protein